MMVTKERVIKTDFTREVTRNIVCYTLTPPRVEPRCCEKNQKSI